LPLTGALKKVGIRKCPHCKDEYGNHSKKQFLRCLYTSDYNFFTLAEKYNALIEEYKKLKGEEVGGEKENKEEKNQ
jgi:hypothetical protein